jgi:hypothetical protein
MLCPVCHQRKAKRACPALGKQICAVCCGTKRLTEIACPPDCGYLSTARTHLETAAKGIVYEHQPSSLLAARLMAELKGVVDEVVKNAGSALERDAAVALRRLEQAATIMVSVRPNTNELQLLLARVLAQPPGPDQQPEAAAPPPPSSLIIP